MSSCRRVVWRVFVRCPSCFLSVLFLWFLPAPSLSLLGAFPRCHCPRRGGVLSQVTRWRSVRPAGVCAVPRGRFPVRWWWSGFPISPPRPPLPLPFRGGVGCRWRCAASVLLCGVCPCLSQPRRLPIRSVCPCLRCLLRWRGCLASSAVVSQTRAVGAGLPLTRLCFILLGV